MPPEAFAGTTYERKAREIIQSIRLTQAYPGEEGKQQIITAYLNQNFYGNQSYGVKAAAKGYFGKSLDQLTLAQDAILAAIPQSPTSYDLLRNAEEVCLDANVAEGQECTNFKLVVPQDSEIVQRRNKVLDLMETRSPLTGNKHTVAEYEAAKTEPVVLVPQVSAAWKAPQFVWQVRRELGQMLCPDSPTDCPKVDTGGFKVVTTLDYTMQKTAEKWVYVAARAPNAKDPSAILASRKIPKSARSWILGLRGHNINNAAASVMDYRTGEVLAYVGSASYTSKGNKKFQPQFDVLSDGWRQPGSAIKPVNYSIGIDDKTLTASTMIMDVTTNFGGGFIPTQADKLERGPVRIREALQFSLNIPAIKATIMSGLQHVFDRSKDFGLSYPNGVAPVLSEGIGTLEVHPIDLLGAYSTIADGGVKMPQRMIGTIVNPDGSTLWPTAADTPTGTQVISPAAAYVITDILAGNTVNGGQPVLGQVGHLRRQDAPARGLQDRHHQRQPRRGRLRVPRATDRQDRPGARGRGVDGQQRQQPERREALARYVGPALVGDPDRGQQGREDRPVQGAARHRERQGRRLHRPQARTVHQEDHHRAVRPGHRPDPEGDAPRGGHGGRRERPAVAGRLCRAQGDPRLLQHGGGRGQLPRLAEGRCGLGRPGGAWFGRRGRPEGHPDVLLLQRRVRTVRPDLGGAVRAQGALPDPGAADLSAIRSPRRRTRPSPRRAACRPPDPGGGPVFHPEADADAAAQAALELDDRRPVAAFSALTGPQ